jgi:cob(I)alamin adenosyltransferase
MIHLYFGDGKGKTTAAVGLAVRAVGSGMKTAVVQFLKGSSSGELNPLRSLGINVLHCPDGTKFIWNMTDGEKFEISQLHTENLISVLDKGFDLIVLDELCDAYDCGVIDKAAVLSVLENPPCELVITGHSPSEIFFTHADYITEMKKHAHPFDKGLPARSGIEY